MEQGVDDARSLGTNRTVNPEIQTGLTPHLLDEQSPEDTRCSSVYGTDEGTERKDQEVRIKGGGDRMELVKDQKFDEVEKIGPPDSPREYGRNSSDTTQVLEIQGRSETGIESIRLDRVLGENSEREELPTSINRRIGGVGDRGPRLHIPGICDSGGRNCRLSIRGVKTGSQEEEQPKGTKLKSDLVSLKEDKNWSKSALISWGGQSRQVFFDGTDAIPILTKKIKEVWGIPRKIFWLSVNGKHELLVTSWPHRSTLEIRIKGPAGGITEEDTGEDDEDTPAPPREKFPKGWIKLGIAGSVYKVHTSLTIEQMGMKFDFETGYEYWLPNGRKVASEEKLRHMFPPGLNQTHFVDEAIPGEPRRHVKELGPVILKIGNSMITVLNNQTFEEAFIKEEIEPQTEFILLPNGRRINANESRIRQYLKAEVDEEVEIRWDPKDTSVQKKEFDKTPMLEQGWIDYTKEKLHLELEEIMEMPDRVKIKKFSVRDDLTQQSQEKGEEDTQQMEVLDPP
jgi:hypothetical protein